MGLQQRIVAELGVRPDADPAAGAERRIGFLVDQLASSGASGYVLGISGGIDSAVAGRLARMACDRNGATFTTVRLPYGVQADEHDARVALRFVEPHRTVVVDIRPAVDALLAAALPDDGDPPGGRTAEELAAADLVKGNVKARIRMTAQYALANESGALVVGTDHAAEAVMGFFTKHGDGACDVLPLSGLLKRQVRAIGRLLGAPAQLVDKAPTADLEDLRPGLPDETVHGCSYDQIDDYLSGLPVPAGVAALIERTYLRTAHKRALPVAPSLP